MNNKFMHLADIGTPSGTMMEITVGDTAMDLLTAAQKVLLGQKRIEAIVEGDIRFTYDGTDPVTGGSPHGAVLYDGAVISKNWQTACAMKVIAYTAGTPATIWLQVMGD